MIAEHKRRSPSAGVIREGASVAEIVQAYERGGAAAISILTEEQNFGGSLEDYRRPWRRPSCPSCARTSSSTVPALRVRGGGRRRDPADRRRARRRRPLRAAPGGARLDLDVLVEVHDEHELERALDVDAEILGLNNRDLPTSRSTSSAPTSCSRTSRRARPWSRSRLLTREQLDDLDRVGIDAVLVGDADARPRHRGGLPPPRGRSSTRLRRVTALKRASAGPMQTWGYV